MAFQVAALFLRVGEQLSPVVRFHEQRFENVKPTYTSPTFCKALCWK